MGINKISDKALVLLSGGQDSTTALFWAKENFKEIYTISFYYGQRHSIELESVKKIVEIANVENKIIDISFLKDLTTSALLKDEDIKINPHNNLPTSFVPGRNMLFLSIAASYAYDKGIRDLVIGVSQVDYSGYPDCRDDFIRSMERTISYAMDTKFRIHAPLIYMSKKDEVLYMESIGKLDVLAFTHTCYKGVFPPCGECPACKLRAGGFKEAGIEDPIYKRIRGEKLNI